MADLKKERDRFYDERDRFLVQVASNPKLSASAKSVAIVIALSHSNWKLFHKGEQWIAWPSIRTLVKSTGCKKRDTIIAAIRQLEEHGHLDVLRPETEGWGHNNKYRWVIKNDEKGPVEGTSLADASKKEKGPAQGTSLDEKGPAERTIEVPPTGPKSYEETYIGAGALTRPSPQSYDSNVSLNIDVVDKSDVLDLSLDDPDATEGLSGGRAVEPPAPALSPETCQCDDLASGHEAGPDPSSAPDDLLNEDWEPDHVPCPDPIMDAPADLPPVCPHGDTMADAVPVHIAEVIDRAAGGFARLSGNVDGRALGLALIKGFAFGDDAARSRSVATVHRALAEGGGYGASATVWPRWNRIISELIGSTDAKAFATELKAFFVAQRKAQAAETTESITGKEEAAYV